MGTEYVYARSAGYTYVGEVLATGKRFEDGLFYVTVSPIWFNSAGGEWEKYAGGNRVFLASETKPVVHSVYNQLPPGFSFK